MAKLALLFPFLFIAGALAVELKQLHLTYGMFDGVFSIPLTSSEALKQGYNWMLTDDNLKINLYAYQEDIRVMICYDLNGNIAGVRIHYIEKDIPTKAISNGLAFDFGYYDNDPMYSRYTINSTAVYSNTVLFTHPDVLAAGGRTGVATTVGDGVYIRLGGLWTLMPEHECDAPSQGFLKAACVATMGKHYFYNVSSTMDCINFNGLFMMYEKGELIGLGLTVFGSHTNAKSRTWYENPSSGVYKLMIPNNRPECVTDWVDNLGATSLHFFFKRFPRYTFCLEKETKC